MVRPELQDLARRAAVAVAPVGTVGGLVETKDEGDSLLTFYFESRHKGYLGRRWAVTVFTGLTKPTVSEVDLVAGPNSLLAKPWKPWAERLAEARASEAQEAEAAEQGEQTPDGVAAAFEPAPNSIQPTDAPAPTEPGAEAESALPHLDEGEEPKRKPSKARIRIPRLFFGRRKNKHDDES